MKSLKYVIIGIIIFITILIGFIIYFSSKNKIPDYIIDEATTPQDEPIEFIEEIHKEESDYRVFSLEDFIANFIVQFNNNNEEAIDKILDSNAKGLGNLNNIKGKRNSFYIQEVYKQESETAFAYYIYGISEYYNEQNEINISKDYFKVRLDNRNFTIAIEEILSEEEYEEIIHSEERPEINKKEIVPNEYNEFDEKNYSNLILSQKYINDYMIKLKYDIDKAYELIDEECKQKKFNNNINNFKQYVEEHKEDFDNFRMYKSEETIENDYIRFNITDDKQNHYIIKRTQALQYKILLDNETV